MPTEKSSGVTDRFAPSKRWTPTLVKDGFTPVSNYFLENYAKLSPHISHAEAMLVIHLMRYKWDGEDPYPSFKTLSEQMGMSEQMARQHARSLEQKKYLFRRIQVGTTNRFQLQPLFDALEARLAAERKKSKKAGPLKQEAAPTQPAPVTPQREARVKTAIATSIPKQAKPEARILMRGRRPQRPSKPGKK
jgi:hypothetical protein